MVEHVSQHTGDMVVSNLVEYLLVTAGAAHKPGGAQEPQMVADNRLRGAGGPGDVANGNGGLKAGEETLRRVGSPSSR